MNNLVTKADQVVAALRAGLGRRPAAAGPTGDSIRADLVAAILRAGAVRHGDFTLASGRHSSYYIDMRLVTLSSDVFHVARAVINAVADRGIRCEAVGGPSSAADPIVGACLALAAAVGESLRGFVVRKEPKEHGTRRLVEGPLRPGDRVVLVEDTTTTGASLDRAAGLVDACGCEVVLAVAVVDRTGEAGPLLAARGVPFAALLTPRDLGVGDGP